jgi:hypothetical protein
VATFSTHQDRDSNWMKEKIEMIKCSRHQFGEIDETSFKILSLYEFLGLLSRYIRSIRTCLADSQ